MPNSDFGPDGTAAPPPPKLFADPLAGLVTADTWIAPQWTERSATSRVSVPTPPPPSEDARRAIRAQLERELPRRPRDWPRPAAQLQWAPQSQTPAAQGQQATPQTGGVAGLVGCLVVLGFFVLVLVTIAASIFSG